MLTVEKLRANGAVIRYFKAVSNTRQISNLALVGFMGTGKSSVGRLVADQLRFTFLDTDEVIEARAGKSIRDIFAQEGEAAFREYERSMVAELRERKNTVIATGGGLAANEENLASLKSHALVICLWASPEKSGNACATKPTAPC